MDDLDGPWKEFLDEFLPEFLLLCFPDIYRRIDWSRRYESLDKELQQIATENAEGRRYVDKLYKVWTLDGAEEWVLIHIEVQNQPSDEFPLRMYVYRYRIFDRFGRHAVSLAVLGDDRPDWRPDRYVDDSWGCRTEVAFPTVKLLDFADRVEELEQSSNPAALVILAHLNAIGTKRNSQQRLASKSHLVRLLYGRGWSPDRVRGMFKFIDWLMRLPKDLAIQFRSDIEALQQEKSMPYVSSFAELAREEGLEEGRINALHESILTVAESKFDMPLAPEVALQLQSIRDATQLNSILRVLSKIDSMDAVVKQIEAHRQ